MIDIESYAIAKRSHDRVKIALIRAKENPHLWRKDDLIELGVCLVDLCGVLLEDEKMMIDNMTLLKHIFPVAEDDHQT